jgi:Spy/CpxP family protein refolding chaperone
MHKKFWLAIVLGAGLAGGAVLHAATQPGGSGHGRIAGFFARLHEAHGGGWEQLHADLNLTPEQVEAIHQVLMSHHADIAAALQPVVDAKRALHNAVIADKADDAAIRTAGAALGKSIGDAAVVFAGIKAELVQKAKPTAEQKAKIVEAHAKTEKAIDALLSSLQQQPDSPTK